METALKKNGLIDAWDAPGQPGIELQKGAGVTRPVPRHWHEEYQLCLIEAGCGEIHYRGATSPTPPASLFIVHPDEVHSNRSWDEVGCSFRTIFLDEETVRRVSGDLGKQNKTLPFIRNTVVFDKDIIERFTRLHISFEQPASMLEQESRLYDLVSDLIVRFSDDPPQTPRLTGKRQDLRNALDYLDSHFADNISLSDLSAVAGLSPFHFNRLFSASFGVPPHIFQIQLRVFHAKKLLREGVSIAEAALGAGFADQSHLNRHFKRMTGVTPGRFVKNSKNVQDRIDILL